MAEQNNRKKKRKKYLRLRKNRTWFSTLLFFIISGVSVGAVLLFTLIFTMFVVNSGVEKEYQAKKQLAALYESGLTDGENPYTVFDTAGITYFIRDGSGNTLASQGENTCSEQSGGFNFYAGEGNISVREDGVITEPKGIQVYTDTEKPVISPKGDDSLTFDVRMFLSETWNTIFGNLSLTDDNTVELHQINLPIWESFPMKDGAETLFFKATIPVSPMNIILVFTMLSAMALLCIIVFLAMVVHAVSSGLNQRRINKLIFTDMKVQCNNWLWFLLHAEHKLRVPGGAKKQFALVDLEFVGYRRFCICHSLDEGEAMLSAIYRQLCTLISKKELCAHSTEDSFALLLKGADAAALRTRLTQMLTALSGIGGDHKLSFHAGIYPIAAQENAGMLTRRKLVDVEEDYNNACAAAASLEGSDGSGVAFYDEKLIEEQRWVDTVTEMQQRAVDNEEFLVYYQPKYDPRTHELRGAEALIRWQSPEYGFLSPYKFIPIFEKNGFITEIDHYMLRHVAKAQRQWLDEGQHCVPVSVNVSRAHFIESDLAEQIRDIVDAEGVPHHLIEIELTESAFFDDKKAMIDTIVKLKQYGFAVSMDDFGAGYSSLNSLKDMPLDVLKLDADFFRGAAAETDRGEIVVSEAIKLAKSLNMRTVAEGVEVKEQVEFLAAQGCDMIQGYYFAKPMPAEEYRARMIAGKSDGDGVENVETASSAG